jgi:hypothetical protein
MIRKTTRLGITYTLTAVLFLTLTGIAEGSIINPNPPPTSPSSPSQPSQGCNLLEGRYTNPRNEMQNKLKRKKVPAGW